MAHGLLITDSFILQDMYSINLKTYLDVTCTIKDNLENAIQLLEIGVQIDLIIVQNKIGNEHVGRGIYNYLLARDFDDIPILILGPDPQVPKGYHLSIIENIYDIKSVIKIAAKHLNITAKDMAQKIVPEYFPIPISIFTHLEHTEFDIFHNQNNNYIKIINAGTNPNQKVKHYQQEGVKNLYVKAEHRLKFTNYFSNNIINILKRKNLTPAQRVESTQIGYDFIAEHIEEVENVNDLVEISKQCVNSMDLIIDEQPEIRKLLNNLFNNQTSYAFKHCQLNAFISAHIINEIDWGTKEHRDKLTFIAFYHDILLTKKEQIIINTNKQLEQSKLSAEEKELVKMHAYKTAMLIQKIPRAPLGSDNIIKQHHGMISGIGFEEGHFSNNLSPLAIVFIIAEEYAAAILAAEKIVNDKADYSEFNHQETIEQLYSRYVGSNYTRAIKTLEKIKL